MEQYAVLVRAGGRKGFGSDAENRALRVICSLTYDLIQSRLVVTGVDELNKARISAEQVDFGRVNVFSAGYAANRR